MHSVELELAGVSELCESRGGRLGFLVHNNPYGLCGRNAALNLNSRVYQSCVKVEVAVLGSSSITIHMVSVDVMQR